MPLAFLAPLFLAAAAAIAIPIIVHLRRREQKDPIPFPSLMFLRRVPHRSSSRRRIQHWSLLLLRALALILIAAAFARPLLRDDGALAAVGGAPARELVILLDRSYSMGVGDRFEQAKQAALDTIATLRQVDRATVIAFDGAARPLSDPMSDRARLAALVTELKVGDGATRYAPALKIAAGILEASALSVKDVLLISDMQRSGWDADPGARLPAGANLAMVSVGTDASADLMVTELTSKRAVTAGRERVTPSARIVNRGGGAATVAVALELDGRPAQRRTVTVPASGAATVEFESFALTVPVRATVSLPADAVTADDERHALFRPGQAVRVLVQGQNTASNLYLTRALALSDEPVFEVTERTGALAAADLANQDVVVLNDVPVPAGPPGARLRELVEQGGGLIVGAGDRSAQASASDVSRALLPALPAGVMDRAREGGVPLGSVERSHPVFDIFRAPRSGDLHAARFLRHARLDELAADSAVQATSDVLARFGDGGAALLERRVGQGRVLLFGTAFDEYWSDLPLQPVFLPLVHRMLLYAGAWEAEGAAKMVGDAVSFDAGDYTAISPSGKRIGLDGERPVLPLEERGFYEVRRGGDRTAAEVVASNVDVTESDLATLDAPAFVSAVETPAGEGRSASRASPDATAAERERTQSLWWYLMLAGFALLAAETVVSNYLSRRPVQREA